MIFHFLPDEKEDVMQGSYEENLCSTQDLLLIGMGTQHRKNTFHVTSQELTTTSDEIIFHVKYNYYDLEGVLQNMDIITKCDLKGSSKLIDELEEIINKGP